MPLTPDTEAVAQTIPEVWHLVADDAAVLFVHKLRERGFEVRAVESAERDPEPVHDPKVDSALPEVCDDLRFDRENPGHPRCESLSPQRSLPCARPDGHTGMHYGSMPSDCTLTVWGAVS